MGNYNTRAIKFCQSKNDFPLTVSLGEKMPTWGLSRWAGNKGLRFIPPDDEGFTLRGDRRRLVYKGQRRSHRITILGDGAFEYDCILLKEPESNVVSLRMEGAEQFDFLRQPDFVPDDFLKGSYAVYLKETLIGQGTGKLCHIHRPEIIDARGRRCWGELSIVGDCLCITIPEKWLGEAAYPVIVDPTVGTTTIGSQNKWYDPDNEGIYELFFEFSFGVNRYLIPETFNGTATAYVYAYNTDYWGRCNPVLYSDNNNVPQLRRSANEGTYDIEVRSGKPAGWRSASISTNTTLSSGSQIWFGFYSEWFGSRFDWGAKCYREWWEGNGLPNNFPVWSVNWFYDFRLSTYFTYTSAQNYVRTLTQGVRLTDTRGHKADYRRVTAQTARLTDLRRITADYRKTIFQSVNGITPVKAMFSFFRQCVQNVGNSTGLTRLPVFNRFMIDNANAITGLNNKRDINRIFVDTANSNDLINRSQGFIRGIIDNIKGTDNNSYNFIFIRTLQDTQSVTDTFQQYRIYIRCLYVEAGNLAETTRHGDLYRTASDTVQVEGSVLRQLFIFIKLVSSSILRDFIIRRFLVAREELVLKSNVTRELTLDSKIN